jgi:hypothetical protein
MYFALEAVCRQQMTAPTTKQAVEHLSLSSWKLRQLFASVV